MPAGRPAGAAVTAAPETSVGERRCLRCGHDKSVGRGTAGGLRRFRCKECGKSFSAVTGTALARLRKKERWLDFGPSLSEGETAVSSAERRGAAVSTAFRRRRRFLAAEQPVRP